VYALWGVHGCGLNELKFVVKYLNEFLLFFIGWGYKKWENPKEPLQYAPLKLYIKIYLKLFFTTAHALQPIYKINELSNYL